LKEIKWKNKKTNNTTKPKTKDCNSKKLKSQIELESTFG
jgi:hypothetical protein